MIQNTFAWLGFIVAALGMVLIICGLITIILDKLQHMWQCWSWAQRQVAAREVGKNILYHSYEFSEHPESMWAIEALGEVLRDSDGWRIDNVRELWHAKLDKHKREMAKAGRA